MVENSEHAILVVVFRFQLVSLCTMLDSPASISALKADMSESIDQHLKEFEHSWLGYIKSSFCHHRFNVLRFQSGKGTK